MLKRVPAWVWLALLPVILGAPFVGRAYFVDDHYHMLMAKGLLDHPTRPYDFLADDAGPENAGWERGQPPRMVNPPLHHYVLALFWKTSGGRLWLVRFFALWISAAAAAIIFFLARRFVLPPEPVTLLAVLTPAFWMSSYALLIDSTMLLFFLAGIWAWIEGLHRGSARWLAAAGIAIGLAILTKYTAVMALPLMGLYWLMHREFRRSWKPLAVFLIPIGMFGLWSWWNVETYGAVHFTESSKRVMQSFAWSHMLVFFAFLSGVFLLPLNGWRELASRRTGPALGLAALVLGFFLASPWGGFPWDQALLMTILVLGGAAFFLRSGVDAFRSKFNDDKFLWLWLAVGVVQMVNVMAWVAARYFLTLLPPVIFLVYRHWQGRTSRAGLARLTAGAAAAMLVFTMVLAIGDYKQAETGRKIVADVTQDGLPGQRRGFFLGDSFTGSGLKAVGWISAFESTPLLPGDLLLHSEIVMPPWWLRRRGLNLKPIAQYDYRSDIPLRVMDNRASAGFYASAWGALPFAITRGPLERYTLFEVQPAASAALPPPVPGALRPAVPPDGRTPDGR